MADKISRIFTGMIARLHEERGAQRQMLDDIAGKVFDAYRLALGDDFTTQEVIRALTYGSDVRDWSSIGPEMQDTLWALCVRHPESVDREKASTLLSDGVVRYLREQGLTISDEHARLFPDLMNGIMQGLEQAGTKFSNDVRQARILGLKPLVDYQNWLVSGGQTFMDLSQYELELRLTDNAIRASQTALTNALVVAGDIKVNYGLTQERIEGIVKAAIKQDGGSQGSPFVVTYETKDGKKGEIDVLRASVTSLTEEADESRLYDLLHEKKINAEYGLENLGYSDSIESLVGLPQNVTQELRANVWRKHLKRFGVDFSQNAEAILVDLTEREKVTFFYGTRGRNGQDNGVMVAFTFDERYGNRYAFVCTRDRMQEDISRAESVRDRVDAAYKPLLEPMAIRAYVGNRQRLTQHRP